MKRSWQTIFICGFALFSMFFGSGNLVFPLKIGQFSGDQWVFGFLGLFLTGIVLPFLGLFIVQKYNGSTFDFFKGAGSIAGSVIPFLCLSLMGSFGIIPRCITVAHGGIGFLFPKIPLFLSSFVFCLLTYTFCFKDESIVQTIGKWLSPLKIGSILLFVLMGVYYAPSELTHSKSLQNSIIIGFLTGYQMMDLIAAFFFSALTFSHMKSVVSEDNLLKFAIKPAILGAVLIGFMYFGFVYLGSHYGFLIKDVSPELMLPTIAMHSLGSKATLLIAIVMSISCLTTAVALNTIYARYIASLLKDRYPLPVILLFTTAVSYVISLMDFKGIAAFLTPMLEIIYPGLIFLTLMSFFHYEHTRIKKTLFYILTLTTFIWTLKNYF